MKKLFIAMLALALLLAGCGPIEPFAPVEERPEIDLPEPQIAEPEAAAPEQTEPAVPEQTEPAAQAGVITVADQFSQTYTNGYGGTFCVHIPKFVLDGNDQLAVNDKIYADHMAKLEENMNNGQQSASAAYAMGQANGYASVITLFRQQEYEFVQYSIFNISTADGQEVSDEQILAAYGHTPDTFRAAVRSVMEQLFNEGNAHMREIIGEQAYQQALDEHLSEAFLSTAKPFIDAQGRLCVMVKFYAFAGAGYYYNRICLEDPSGYPDPQSIVCAEHN